MSAAVAWGIAALLIVPQFLMIGLALAPRSFWRGLAARNRKSAHASQRWHEGNAPGNATATVGVDAQGRRYVEVTGMSEEHVKKALVDRRRQLLAELEGLA